MPEFNKSRGFKMSGYSYPGESPVKGRKAKKAAAAAALETAMGEITDVGNGEMKSTNIMDSESPALPTENDSALPKRAPVKNVDWSKVATSAMETGAEAIVSEGVSAGINALTKKNDKSNKGPDTEGFASIKYGS